MKKIIACFALIFSSIYAQEEMIENFKIQGKSTKPKSTIDLTITKKISQKLVAKINKEEGEIIVNLKDKGEIVVGETLEDLSSASIKGKGNTYTKTLNINNDLNRGKVVKMGNYTYELVNFENLRSLKIKYETEPKDLYVGILKKSQELKKVYKLDFQEKITEDKGLVFIMDEANNLSFNIEEDLIESEVDSYEAFGKVIFQVETKKSEEEIKIDIRPKEEEVILTEVRLTKDENNEELKELRVINLKVTKKETKEITKKKKPFIEYVYEIKGEIEKEEVDKLGKDLGDYPDLRFIGDVGIEVELK